MVKIVSAPAVRSGFSLVELMVVVILMVMVTAAGFTLFQIGARHEARQQDVLNQTQNLRAALYLMARDVRMAGNGLGFLGTDRLEIFVSKAAEDPNTQEGGGWFRYKDAEKYGARAIYGTNGPCAGAEPDQVCEPDTLTVFRAELEQPMPLSSLGASFTPGKDIALQLRDAVTKDQTIADGDMLVVASGGRAVLVQISLGDASHYPAFSSLYLGERFKPGAELPDKYTFGAGSSVYNLRDVVFVTYYLDRGAGHNRLMANYHDDTVKAPDEGVTNLNQMTGDINQVAVAGNIEDLQVNYFLSPPGEEGPGLGGCDEKSDLEYCGVMIGLSPDINEGALDDGEGQLVRLVGMALASRSSRNRDGGGAAGAAYTRQALTETVTVRNHTSF